jgi:MOSC domain-containing protein YiiM
MRVDSVQTGKVQDLGDWTTATYKYPVAGPVFLHRLGVTGDEFANTKNHGGVDKAVLAAAAGQYPLWRQETGNPDWSGGALGENLTIAELDETVVCVGDTWRIGETLTLEISQPRQPCWKQAKRWGIPDLVVRMIETGRTGWYHRVLVEGPAAAGDALTLLARPHPAWTVARANHVMHAEKTNADAARALWELPELSASWKHELARRF